MDKEIRSYPGLIMNVERRFDVFYRTCFAEKAPPVIAESARRMGQLVPRWELQYLAVYDREDQEWYDHLTGSRLTAALQELALSAMDRMSVRWDYSYKGVLRGLND